MTTGFPEPTRADHRRFCLVEGWTEVRNARGKIGHHVVYELTLPDGRVLRTRISHPPGRQHYGQGLWKHILRDQLDIDEREFWDCLNDKVAPARGRPEQPVETIPAAIVNQLLANGIAEAEIRAMSKSEAIHRITEIWSRP